MGQMLVKLAIKSGKDEAYFYSQREGDKNFAVGIVSRNLRADRDAKPEGCSLTLPMPIVQAIKLVRERPDLRRGHIDGIILQNNGGKTISLGA